MTIYQIQGAFGGCGASAVAWTVAQQVRATAAFDLSAHQGGLGWCASGDVDTSWPRIVAAEIDRDQLLEVSRSVDSIRICSGGMPPPPQLLRSVINAVGESEPLVLDGGATVSDSHQLWVMPNHLRAMKRLREIDGWILCGMSQDGVPAKLVEQSLPRAHVIFFKHQPSVRRSLQLGYSMPQSSSMRKAVDAWLKLIPSHD